MPQKNNNAILISRFSALGDVAIAIPVIYAACRANPDTRFVVLTRKLPAKIFLNPPENLTVVGIDTGLYRGVGGMFRLFSALHKEYRFTAFADFHDVLRTQLLRIAARVHGVRCAAIRKGRFGKWTATRNWLKSHKQLTPVSDRYRAVLERLSVKTMPDNQTPILPPEEIDDRVYAKVSPPPAQGERWIAVAPFAAHKGKVYPLNLMKDVVDTLANLPGHKIFLFGAGEKEKKEIREIAGSLPNVVSVAEAQIGIQAEMHLMARCDIMLAMDSANAHLASLMMTRTLTVWGATQPKIGFYPARQRPEDAISLRLPCSPCSVFGKKTCKSGDYRCLHNINPSVIISAMNHNSNIQK